MINLNDIARKVTLAEGGAINTSIAQVKEVIRLTLIELSQFPAEEVKGLLDLICKAQEAGETGIVTAPEEEPVTVTPEEPVTVTPEEPVTVTPEEPEKPSI